ncbi:hypothetical protein OSB04_016937 [Centaurea solstitialis]|uniref:Uncharacterized protein n=1 Tax=Centaurea solstitialis TaxID=347529 RepID=A0AA38W8Z8_9ASTR|nr:hypothetical protein OSB04_016937 [Centaurea solstitialis]
MAHLSLLVIMLEVLPRVMGLTIGFVTFNKVAYVEGLMHNILSIINFDFCTCFVVNDQGDTVLSRKMKENVYVINMDIEPESIFEDVSILKERFFTPSSLKGIKPLISLCVMSLLNPRVPMAPSLEIDFDLNGNFVNITEYRGMIGSLIYLTASRPDIMFFTCFCARFQVDPKESHLNDVKRIFRYLKGTPDLGLWYPKDSGSKLDRKSTTSSCQLLGGKLVRWSSKKQHSVSTSTAEAEYVAAGS